MWASICTQVWLRLPLLAGGELVGSERRLAERHLLGCERCRRQLAELRRTQNVLRAAAADHETVPGLVEGACGLGRGIVVLGRHGTHGVEQAGEGPVDFFSSAGEDDVLLAPLDLLDAGADAMGAGRAGGGDRVVDALDPERCRQARRDAR